MVADRINFRNSLRSSSTREPSDPLPTVVCVFVHVVRASQRQAARIRAIRYQSRMEWLVVGMCVSPFPLATGQRGGEGGRRWTGGPKATGSERAPRVTLPRHPPPEGGRERKRARGTRRTASQRERQHRCVCVCVGVWTGVDDGWTAGAATNANTATTPPRLWNDPSAGSPTETLLRLLLPLNDQV